MSHIRSVSNRTLQLNVSAASPDGDAGHALYDFPALRDNVPSGEVVARELEGDRLGLAWVQEDGVEALEVERGGVR